MYIVCYSNWKIEKTSRENSCRQSGSLMIIGESTIISYAICPPCQKKNLCVGYYTPNRILPLTVACRQDWGGDKNVLSTCEQPYYSSLQCIAVHCSMYYSSLFNTSIEMCQFTMILMSRLRRIWFGNGIPLCSISIE